MHTNVLKTRDIMNKRLFTLHQNMDVYDAIDALLAKGLTSAAVVDDKGSLVGILSEKDCLITLIKEVYHNLPGSNVTHYMTKNVVTVHPDTDILVVADMFLKNHFRRLLVVEDNKLVGQVTRRDLLVAIQKLKGRKVYNVITGRYEAKNISFF